MNCSQQHSGLVALFERLEGRRLMSAGASAGATFIAGNTASDLFVLDASLDHALDHGTLNATPGPALPGPQKLQVTGVTSQTITIEWNEVKADAYLIDRSIDGKQFNQVGKVEGNATTQFTDTNLASGVKFFYRVRSVLNDTPSAPGPVADATTLTGGSR